MTNDSVTIPLNSYILNTEVTKNENFSNNSQMKKALFKLSNTAHEIGREISFTQRMSGLPCSKYAQVCPNKLDMVCRYS